MTAPLSLLAAQSPIAPPGRFRARSWGPSLRAFFIQVGSGTLQNDGVVIGNKYGVLLTAGGSVTNGAGDASAKISGVGSVGVSGTSFGVFVIGNSATVTNYGTIDGGPTAGSEGAELDQGGNVTNNSGGTISGTGFGVFIESNSASRATVINAGAISGNNRFGRIRRYRREHADVADRLHAHRRRDRQHRGRGDQCSGAARERSGEQQLQQALSRCRAASAKCRRLRNCQDAATAVRHVVIAAARSTRCAWAEVRWRWTLKVL
jgi:hypothetical protein